MFWFGSSRYYMPKEPAMSEKYSEADRKLLRKVGMILRQHRRRCGLTQEQAAERACLNVTYLSDVERGKRNISLINLAHLADAFALPLEDIFVEDVRENGSKICE